LSSMSSIVIRPVLADELQEILAALVALLVDTVDGGHSMGFLPPLTRANARRYWLSLRPELQAGSRLLLVASCEGNIIGTGQLVLSPWSNSQHRAELQKLFVASSLRGRGIGKLLLAALHDAARQRGRSLLVLNTRQGEPAQELYKRLGYTEVGVVPGWTLGPAGEKYAHVTLYQHLS
jgi:GNAT superfamily N-acetyltransferase